jgi:putative membrane protein
MSARFLADGAEQAFKDAVATIESNSAAEVVVAVRRRSGSYGHVPVIFGVAAAMATLAVLLYSPWSFGLAWFLIDPPVVGLGVGFFVARMGHLQRALTSEALKRGHVRRTAREAFLDRRVHTTQGRTGVLVYISLLEQMVEVVADTGVEDLVEGPEWENAVTSVEETLRATMDGSSVAEALETMGEILAEVLERGPDDINELPDEVAVS